MERLEYNITIFYNDGSKSKTKKVSLWHDYDSFLFYDNNNIVKVVVNGHKFYTQEEYDAFYRGVTLVRDLFVALLNY